jgi:hypothetical protein
MLDIQGVLLLFIYYLNALCARSADYLKKQRLGSSALGPCPVSPIGSMSAASL